MEQISPEHDHPLENPHLENREDHQDTSVAWEPHKGDIVVYTKEAAMDLCQVLHVDTSEGEPFYCVRLFKCNSEKHTVRKYLQKFARDPHQEFLEETLEVSYS